MILDSEHHTPNPTDKRGVWMGWDGPFLIRWSRNTAAVLDYVLPYVRGKDTGGKK